MATRHSTLTTTNLHQPFHYEQDGDPGAVGASKWWYAPTDNALSRRNAANTAWVEYSGAGGEGVFLIDGDNARITDDDAADVTLTNAAGESDITFPHTDIALSARHEPFHWNQETDPATTNPSDVVANHWWFKESTMTLKRRNAGDTAWEDWL